MSWLRGRVDQASGHGDGMILGVWVRCVEFFPEVWDENWNNGSSFREHGCLSLVARTPRTERVSPAALKCTD